MKELLKSLCELSGVPGYEEPVRAFIEERAKPCADEVFTDALGSLLVFKKGENAPAAPIMLCAHMDEVGFLIKSVTDDGMIKLVPAGGIDERVLIGRRMLVGKRRLPGLISLKAIHLTTPEERKTAPEMTALYADIGARTKAAAEALVSVGEPVVFDTAFEEMGTGCVKARALDDRVGCAVLLALLRETLPFDAWFVFSASEEIGARGAAAAVQHIEPSIICVVEGTPAADLPEVPAHLRSVCLRGGAAVSLMDSGTLYPRALRDRITAAADAHGIKWQYRTKTTGANDASAAVCGCGAKTFGLSVPVRYPHSAVSLAYFPDIEQVRTLAALFIEKAGETHA